jgi:hypothetical protein
MIIEKDVAKADISMLIIMCFESLGGGQNKAVSNGAICLQDVEAVTFSRQGTC